MKEIKILRSGVAEIERTAGAQAAAAFVVSELSANDTLYGGAQPHVVPAYRRRLAAVAFITDWQPPEDDEPDVRTDEPSPSTAHV